MQEINVQNMNVELVAQMFKNYQSNVLFHLEGMSLAYKAIQGISTDMETSYRQPEGAVLKTAIRLREV